MSAAQADVPELMIAPARRGWDGVVTQFDAPEGDRRLSRVIRASRLRLVVGLLRGGAAALSSKAIASPAKAAEPHFRQALWWLGPAIVKPHPMNAYALDRLGLALQLQGKNDEVEGLYLRSLALQQEGGWPPTPWTEVTLLNLAILYSRQGKTDVSAALRERFASCPTR